MNNYGNFSSDGKTYIINTPNTPCQWQNYIWNKEFLTIFSQIGQGKALKQDSNGVRTNLITSRMVYIIDADSNEFWTANGIPVHKEYKDFKAIHGLGFSSISLMYNDIKTTYRVFVPQNDNCEIWTITLENTGNALSGVTISDILPKGTVFVSGDTGVSVENGNVSWTGDVAQKSTVTVSYTVMITENTAGALIVSNESYVSGVKLGNIVHTVSALSEEKLAILAQTGIDFATEEREFASALDMIKTIY